MAGSPTYNWWQWSAYAKNLARNSRITEPEGDYLEALRIFLKAIWNPVTKTGTRPWLNEKFLRLSVNSGYGCNLDEEPAHVLVEMLNHAGRDFKKIPITDAEVILFAQLLTSAGYENYLRVFGSGPYFGGVSGSSTS